MHAQKLGKKDCLLAITREDIFWHFNLYISNTPHEHSRQHMHTNTQSHTLQRTALTHIVFLFPALRRVRNDSTESASGCWCNTIAL